jgi:hypothetical protein
METANFKLIPGINNREYEIITLHIKKYIQRKSNSTR